MADVFLSYSRKNATTAEELVALLQAEGWSVWYDDHIAAGHRFRADIDAELTAAKVVVVLWSVDSIQSMWVNAEAEEAVRLTKLLPLRLDDCQIPLTLRAFQTIDFTSWSGDPAAQPWQALRKSIYGLAGPPLAPETAPQHDLLVGSTEDATHTSISTALSASRPGYVIAILPGLYHESLTIADDVELVGLDPDSGQVVIDGAELPAATIKNASVTMRHLVLKSRQQSALGVLETDASVLMLSRVEIIAEGDAAGLRSASRGQLDLRDCTVSGGKFGCHAAFQSNVRAMRCQFQNHANHGLLIDRGSRLSLHNSCIEKSDGCGVLADSLSDLIIRSSEFKGHEVAGVEVRGGSSADIRFCKFDGNGQGVRASGRNTSAEIISNEIENCTNSCVHALQLAEVRIVDNRLRHSAGGIIAFGKAAIVATANEVTDHTGHGIEVREGSTAELSHNLVFQISMQGLRCNSGAEVVSFADHIAVTQEQGIVVIAAKLRTTETLIAETASVGISVFDGSEVVIRRVLVDRSMMTGVDLVQGSLDADELTTDRCSEHGVRLLGESSARLVNCELRDSGLSGVRVESTNVTAIERCRITGSDDYGIHLLAGCRTEVRSSIVAENRAAGICLEEGAVPLIEGNLIEKNAAEGLRIHGAGGGFVGLTVFRDNAVAIGISIPQDELQTRFDGVVDDPTRIVLG